MTEESDRRIMAGDIIFGLVIMALSGFAFHQTIAMPVISQSTLGSAFWPRIVASLLFLLGIVLIITALLAKQTKPYFSLPEEKTRNVADLFLIIGVLVLYGLLWNRVAFLITTPIFLLLTGLIVRMRLRTAIVLAVVMPPVLYLIFRVGLSVMIR